MVAQWAHAAGIKVEGLGVHGLRATAATNALEHDADIAMAVTCQYQHHAALRPKGPAH